jgi:type I restriction enzyme S subunit
MKQGWEVRRLDDLCQIELGKTPYRGDKSFWDTENKSDNVWLSIADLLNTDGDVVSNSKEYITDKAAKVSKIVKEGTLLLSFKLTLGRLAFAGRDLFTNEAIAALTIKNNEVIDKYFLYQFLSLFDWNAATEGDVKVKGKTLNKAKLKEIEVHFPKSLPEQQRIVAILDEAFAAIAQAKANAEQNLKNAKELFESYLQSVFENKGEGWEERRLGESNLIEIIDGDRGKNYPTQKDFFDEGFCLFMNTKNVRPTGFEFNSTMFISEVKDKSMGKGKLKRNDVVLTTRGTIGNLGVFNDDVQYDNIRINSGMLIFRPNLQQITSQYLFEILRSGIIKEQIKKQVTGAAQPQLPIKTLVNFVFPVPKSIQEQQAIVQKLDALSAETKQLETIYQQKINDLDELKKSILQKAFAGELNTAALEV